MIKSRPDTASSQRKILLCRISAKRKSDSVVALLKEAVESPDSNGFSDV